MYRHKLVCKFIRMYRRVGDKLCKLPEQREVWSLLKHLARHSIRQLDANDIPKRQDCNTANRDSGVANGIGVDQIFVLADKVIQ